MMDTGNTIDNNETQRSPWPMAAVAVIATLLGTHLVVYRPMKNQMELQVSNMQRQLTAVRGDMQKLVSAQSNAKETNDLLNELNQQRDQMREARLTLASITSFRRRVQREVEATNKTMADVKKLTQLQSSIATSRKLATDAADTLEQVHTLHRRMIVAGKQLEGAKSSLNEFVALKNRIEQEAGDLEDAECRLIELGYLKSLVMDESKDVKSATVALNSIIGLKNTINGNSTGTVDAMMNAERLIILKENIADHGISRQAMDNARRWLQIGEALNESREQSQLASNIVRRMITITNDLSTQHAETETAEKNLKSLMSMRDHLSKNSRQVAAAVQTLELLTDLHKDVTKHVQTMTGLRKSLLEIVLLESTVARTVKAMQPLVQLGNLRRLSDREVREAARTIMNNRRGRLGFNSNGPSGSRPLTPNTKTGNNPFRGLVPSPMDLD